MLSTTLHFFHIQSRHLHPSLPKTHCKLYSCTRLLSRVRCVGYQAKSVPFRMPHSQRNTDQAQIPLPRRSQINCGIEVETNLMPAKLSTQPRVPALPFQAQHRVLAAVQRRLERCVFDFARRRYPDLCQSKDWDCAEKVELHTAFRALEQGDHGRLVGNTAISPKEALGRLRANVVGIRHAAVHRERQSHRQLLKKLDTAHRFATVWLGDRQCGTELQRCRLQVDALYSQWKKRSGCIAANLDARIGLLSNSGRAPLSDRYRRLLVGAARRLAQRNLDDCVAQVDRIIRITFSAIP